MASPSGRGAHRGPGRLRPHRLQHLPPPGQLVTRFAGSSDLYEDDGRKPSHSINNNSWDQGGLIAQ